MTNAEWLKSLDNEVLAAVLSSPCLGCVIKDCRLHNYGSFGCHNKFVKWLGEPHIKDTFDKENDNDCR